MSIKHVVLFFFLSLVKWKCPKQSVLFVTCCSPSQSQAHLVRHKMISIDPRAVMLHSMVLQQKAARDNYRMKAEEL